MQARLQFVGQGLSYWVFIPFVGKNQNVSSDWEHIASGGAVQIYTGNLISTYIIINKVMYGSTELTSPQNVSIQRTVGTSVAYPPYRRMGQIPFAYSNIIKFILTYDPNTPTSNYIKINIDPSIYSFKYYQIINDYNWNTYTSYSSTTIDASGYAAIQVDTVQTTSYYENIEYSLDGSEWCSWGGSIRWSTYYIQQGSKFYLRASPKTYTISYNSNGGTYIESCTVPYGVYSYISDTIPEKQNYSFIKWEGSDGEDYSPGASVWLTGNLTLYAIWEQVSLYTTIYRYENIQHTISGKTRCSETPVPPTNYTKISSEQSTPTKTGRTFYGWYPSQIIFSTSSLTSGLYTSNNDAQSPSRCYAYNGNNDILEFNGYFSPIIHYNANGGIFSSNSESSLDDITDKSLEDIYVMGYRNTFSYRVIEEEPIKNGSIFLGWKLNNGDSIYKYDGTLKTILVNPSYGDEYYNFKAVWQSIKPTTVQITWGNSVAQDNTDIATGQPIYNSLTARGITSGKWNQMINSAKEIYKYENNKDYEGVISTVNSGTTISAATYNNLATLITSLNTHPSLPPPTVTITSQLKASYFHNNPDQSLPTDYMSIKEYFNATVSAFNNT